MLELLPDFLAVARLEPTAAVPDWASRGSFLSISRTSDELSIVCRQTDIPPDVKSEQNFRALKVRGPLDFSLTGILASIAQPLADVSISIFAVSTFDTDYVLVNQEALEKTTKALQGAGHVVFIAQNPDNPKIDFLPLQEEHIPLLRKWLKEAHVAEFWQETDDEEVFRKKYLNKLADRGVSPFVIAYEDRPIGYIQHYEACEVGHGWWTDAQKGTFGIDQLIGDPTMVNRGIGTEIIKRFVANLFLDPSCTEVITDPDPKNKRAIRVYEKVGFAALREIKTPGGDAVLMRITRPLESESLSLKQYRESDREDFSALLPFSLGAAIPQLPSGNIDITERFFHEKLGFQTVAKYQEQNFLIVKRESAEIHFWQTSTEKEARTLGSESSCYIRVENIAAFFEELQTRRATFRYELVKQPWGMNEMQIDDPYGNAIRFGEAL